MSLLLSPGLACLLGGPSTLVTDLPVRPRGPADPPTCTAHAHVTPSSPKPAAQGSGGGAGGPAFGGAGHGAGGTSAAEGEDDYEGLGFSEHMVAGAAAGIAEHVAMFPVDTVKTRAQALAHPGQRLRGGPVAAAVASILRREGLRGLYGGVTAVAVGAGPAHALYFAVYEWVKKGLGPGGWNGPAAPPLAHPTLAASLAGATATIVSDGVMTPCDVVKQRLQVVGSPYSGVADCVARTLAAEGPGAFFKSLRTTLVTNIPFTALHFGTYEAAKGAAADVRDAWLAWSKRGKGGDGGSAPRSLPWWWELVGDEEGLLTQLTAGGAAGGVAAAATTPLDVAKTRLQLEGVTAAARYDGRGAVFPTLARIAREEGPAALWAGLRPRVHAKSSPRDAATRRRGRRRRGNGRTAGTVSPAQPSAPANFCRTRAPHAHAHTQLHFFTKSRSRSLQYL